jgi:hypothetical protein
MANFFPEAPPAAGELAREMTLSAARGESESAQVVIVAGTEPLDIQRVEVSDLRRGAQRIGQGQITVHLVGYVEIKENENSWRGIKRPGLWPDPLLRFRPFTCPAGEARSLWVTVKVPRTTTPGRYEGDLRLYSAGSPEASVPLKLTVWNFSLPRVPRMHTSYWTHTEAAFDLAVEPEAFRRTLRLFGEYRTSTDLWPSWDFRDPKNMRDWVVLWYLEQDGTITCDLRGMQRTIKAAVDAGFGTLQIGHGCWMGDEFEQMPLIDRQTGRLLPVGGEVRESALRRLYETLPPEQQDGFPGTYFARLFLPPMCDWLASQGLLERSYMQLYDEAPDPGQWPAIAALYHRYRRVEPRLKLLGLTTIHPFMQGVYDIWSPDLYVYDPETYDRVRQGISLRGPRNFRATVTASSSGNYPSGHLDYQPGDAYDGCDYTHWTPAADPSAEAPQWIRFDFDDPAGGIDGLRVVPFPRLPWDHVPTDTVWVVEASRDGQSFAPLELAPRAGLEGACSFPWQPYQAVRLTHAKRGSQFAPASPPDALALNTASQMIRPDGTTYVMPAHGVCEVEFLREEVPLEATRARDKVRPAEMWEYQYGATYPSVCIDADPAEMRAHAWQCWARGARGYLNAGGAQWEASFRPPSEDPLIWTVPVAGGQRGAGFIVYPGQKEVLPSVRLARFRDGVDDYDYLMLLSEKQPDHPVLQQLREGAREPYAFTGRWAGGGPEPYGNIESMLQARAAVAESLDRLYAGPGRWVAPLDSSEK